MVPTLASKTASNADENTISKELTSICSWTENITEINLSNKILNELDNSVRLPPNLRHLNLSNNLFENVPESVINLEKLQSLDMSCNKIYYFDDTPKFCHSIIKLCLNNNNLQGPPFWVWKENPKNLVSLNMSCNKNLLYSLCDDYRKQFLKYTCTVEDIKINNCDFSGTIDFFKTIGKVKSLTLGVHNIYTLKNYMEDFPPPSLTKCCDIERLYLCNVNIYNLMADIKCFKMLKEINLSMNNISDLAPEFCELTCLETCILSFNRLLYLPENFTQLKNLKHLQLDHNKLCMLSGLRELPNLKYLDVYDNDIDCIIEEYEDIESLDFAQNFIEEPDNAVYLEKKQKLRTSMINENRLDGIKPEVDDGPDDRSTDNSEEYDYDPSEITQAPILTQEDPDSDEDWDSDAYWEPTFMTRYKSEPEIDFWVQYVKQKMREGNFCPMDCHTVPIIDQIQYKRLCNPEPPFIPVDGQFDDPENE